MFCFYLAAFSKFTLKPSALSQLTANFNKKLEQVPAPKIDSTIDLLGTSLLILTCFHYLFLLSFQSVWLVIGKPSLNQENESSSSSSAPTSETTTTATTTTTTTTTPSATESLQNNEQASTEAAAAQESSTASSNEYLNLFILFLIRNLSLIIILWIWSAKKEFVFGENITERVVNTISPTVNGSGGESGGAREESGEGGGGGESQNETGEENGEKSASKSAANNAASSWLNDAESAEKYANALHESDLYSLCKINCKLYVLEADKTNWAERGYGILKVIETSDGSNCRISKTFFLDLIVFKFFNA